MARTTTVRKRRPTPAALPQWDVPAIIGTFKGPLGLVTAFREHSLPAPTEGQVRMWAHRKSLPPGWVPALIVLLRAARPRLPIQSFILTDPFRG